MSDSVTSAPVCDSRSSFCGWIWTEKAPTSQHLALRNITNIEHRSLFQLLQNLRARDAEGLGKRRPDASRLHAPSHLRSCENRVLSSNNSANTGCAHTGYRLRDQLHLAARQQEIHCLDLCLLGASLLVTPVSLVASWKNGHVHRITMHGHLTCPERFWHVSDTRIGTISNPEFYCTKTC